MGFVNGGQNNNPCIILTTTVRVRMHKVGLFQSDMEERRELYVSRIKQWLVETELPIVVVENSGYAFDELIEYKRKYANRFDVCSYDEKTHEGASYLQNDPSKGCSELYAIQYARNHSQLLSDSDYVIKVTGRFFIPDLERYIYSLNLMDYDAITQNDSKRCEMIGCRMNKFDTIFCQYALDKYGNRQGHVEDVYHYRTTELVDTVLRCKLFNIEPTLRGGVNKIYSTI